MQLPISTNELLPTSPADSGVPLKEPIHSDGIAFYEQIKNRFTHETVCPFILIDSKSQPRSGLHYLKNTLTKILGDQFSFCEWYQEIGCCKQHPCMLKGYAEHACKTNRFRLRLIKSHDFDHTDPAYNLSAVLRRVVIIRDPLYALTSWFELDELAKCKHILLENGIDIRKIWLMHEQEVLQSAYSILDAHFSPPQEEVLRGWLNEKTKYMQQFITNWVKPYISNSDPYAQVIDYEGIDRYITELLQPYRDFLSSDAKSLLDKFASNHTNGFQKREDPFAVHVSSLSSYARNYEHWFRAAAEKIYSCEDNLMRGIYSIRTENIIPL
jgi:hypothetical protein